MISKYLICVLEMIVDDDDEEEDCDNCKEKKDDGYREKASRMKVFGSSNRKMWMP